MDTFYSFIHHQCCITSAAGIVNMSHAWKWFFLVRWICYWTLFCK